MKSLRQKSRLPVRMKSQSTKTRMKTGICEAMGVWRFFQISFIFEKTV
ncbi:hypothetical protein HMPREF0860_0534 [Treponema socranskii subsp. socranskii VPI DR56BR1116 = ATCC 35536]|uniref:Uncharacterized protein n=1 Tax=Treponema socranskii subsp. socranskii VPI DR56BR1116 = ATCC 35536 TaxID=1125725 RepID=U1GS84_TRESO|nr:hypothetical protein HMPREF1325_0390 [Treponema socranskii subsp. socranskii VPI DR56BR1116 = ATCC 35536]ERJ99800.1 hypothetical protein HMPREF0860_0534 [Treponema socranskii subsp. socranskii VPI DR56BR1116 = ATCC 35536]